jgi:hypothetical protein
MIRRHGEKERNVSHEEESQDVREVYNGDTTDTLDIEALQMSLLFQAMRR